MQCACSIDIDCDGEFWAYEHTFNTDSREEERCDECGRAIPEGEEFEVFVGMPSEEKREPSHHATCADCQSMRHAYFCSYIFGEIWDEFERTICEAGVDDMLDGRMMKLTPAARNMACKIFEKFICQQCGEALGYAGGFDDNEDEPLCETCFAEKYPEKV